MRTIIFIMISFMSFGQLEVKETTNSSETIWSNTARQSITAFYEDDRTFYAFYYQNAKYTAIISTEYVSFSNREELIQFLDLAQEAIEEGKEFSTENYRLTKGMGKKSCTVWGKVGYTYITLKTISKIREALEL